LVPPTSALFWLALAGSLPLEAELGGVVAGHLDDQAFDVDLRAPVVELVDHRPHLPVERLRRGDDQRVGRRVGLDEAAGRRPRRGRDRRRRRARAAGAFAVPPSPPD
jgi:hypothetical protein